MWTIRKPGKTAAVRDTATGPCVICGKESDGSPYWVGIGPVPTKFAPDANLPLCGPICSAVQGGDDDWQRWLKPGGRRP